MLLYDQSLLSLGLWLHCTEKKQQRIKELFKTFMHLDGNLEQHPNLIIFSLTHYHNFLKMSLKSINNFSSYFASKKINASYRITFLADVVNFYCWTQFHDIERTMYLQFSYFSSFTLNVIYTLLHRPSVYSEQRTSQNHKTNIVVLGYLRLMITSFLRQKIQVITHWHNIICTERI